MWKALYTCAWIVGNIVNKLTLTNRLVSTTQSFSILHVTLVMLIYHHTVRGK